MFFICISRNKLLFIALYIVIEGSLSMFGVMKNDFSAWAPEACYYFGLLFVICQQGRLISMTVQKGH